MNQDLRVIQQAVNQSWQRIENWLRDNAPDLLKLLNPPATEEEIKQAEAIMKKQFPSSVQFSYLQHNGLGKFSASDDGHSFFDYYHFMPLNGVIVRDEELKQLEREYGVDSFDTVKQIPFCQFQADYFCVESSLNGEETVLTDWHSRNPEYMPMAESFAAYLVSFVERLENGEFYYDDYHSDLYLMRDKHW